MFERNKDQSAHEGAAAIQAGGSANNATINQTNNYGTIVTVDEIRAIAKDSFKADFVQMLGQAGDIAEARANRVTERFLERMQAENPTGIDQANNPDFRYALFSAQKALARSGGDDLEELLVELLIERSKEDQRNLQQIVLGEALEVVSRLTASQIAALTITFILRCTQNEGILDFSAWLQYMDTTVKPFIDDAKLSNAAFSHMAFTGCGVVEITSIKLAHLFRSVYPGIWQTGQPTSNPIIQQLTTESRKLLKHSSHTSGHLEVFGGTQKTIDNIINSNVSNEVERATIKQLASISLLDDDQIKSRCIAARPYMESLFDLWDNTSARQFMPSSVGIAIAHSSLKQKLPRFGSLSIWIN